jgi:two-component system sensor histidine kinase AlgZ
MCLLLADFLRDTLRLGATQRISLREELSVVQRYLAIEQVRLGARLKVDCAASDEAGGGYLPALLLQPLVENAVLHGIAHLIDGGTVTIGAQRQGAALLIRVSNPSDPARPRRQRAGLGLLLVRQRLQSEYGAAGQLQTREERGEFVAEVSLPFTEKEEAVE